MLFSTISQPLLPINARTALFGSLLLQRVRLFHPRPSVFLFGVDVTKYFKKQNWASSLATLKKNGTGRVAITPARAMFRSMQRFDFPPPPFVRLLRAHPMPCVVVVVVVQTEISTANFDISVQEFYDTFFGDNAPHGLPNFHATRGDSEVILLGLKCVCRGEGRGGTRLRFVRREALCSSVAINRVCCLHGTWRRVKKNEAQVAVSHGGCRQHPPTT